MLTRRTILASVTIAFVVGSVFGLAVTSSGASAAGTQVEATENATIHVSASDDVSAPPDLALIRPSVVATGDTAEAARRQVAENAASVRATLREMGIADDQVRTTYFDISPTYESPQNRTEITGYRAAQGFEIEVDVAPDELGNRTGSIVDAVVQNGANGIDSVQFTLSDDRRGELRREALSGALNTARGEADHLATESGLSLTGVDSISTADGRVSPVDASFQESAAESPATVFEPGPVTVSASVTVTYRAE